MTLTLPVAGTMLAANMFALGLCNAASGRLSSPAMRTAPRSPGDRIRERRLAMGIGQTELADMAGVSRSLLVKMENTGSAYGARNAGRGISAVTCYKLAKALNWRIEDIIDMPRLYPIEEDESTGTLTP